MTYEYVFQHPSLLPTTAKEAGQYCRSQGATSAELFNQWGSNPMNNFVTYRCVK